MYLWMFHRRVIHFSSALKKIYKMRPDFRWILCWILPYAQPILLAWTDPRSRECYANYFKGLTFRILNKNFQEMASRSIVLNLHASLLRRCRQILYNCYFQVQFLDTFRYTANEFNSKILLLFILDFKYENFKSLWKLNAFAIWILWVSSLDCGLNFTVKTVVKINQ